MEPMGIGPCISSENYSVWFLIYVQQRSPTVVFGDVGMSYPRKRLALKRITSDVGVKGLEASMGFRA